MLGATAAQSVLDPITHDPVFFAALPGAGVETARVARDLGTVPALNGGFTPKALLDGLARKPRVLHIASHFRYVSGDDRRSFLVTGGDPWTVEAIKALPDGALGSLDPRHPIRLWHGER